MDQEKTEAMKKLMEKMRELANSKGFIFIPLGSLPRRGYWDGGKSLFTVAETIALQRPVELHDKLIVKNLKPRCLIDDNGNVGGRFTFNPVNTLNFKEE